MLKVIPVLSETSLLWDGVVSDMASGSDGHVPTVTSWSDTILCVIPCL